MNPEFRPPQSADGRPGRRRPRATVAIAHPSGCLSTVALVTPYGITRRLVKPRTGPRSLLTEAGGAARFIQPFETHKSTRGDATPTDPASARRPAPRPLAPRRGATPVAAATRARLLDAAERLFAARGFRATSVRHITAEARSNLASVNYHFGGKAGLYREMFHRRLRAVRDQRVTSIRAAVRAAGPRASLETLLRAFTIAFLDPHLDEASGGLLVKLMNREMFDPHLHPSTVRREIVAPVQEAMIEAFAEVGIAIGERAARQCVQSLVAQLVHVVRMRVTPGAVVATHREDFDFPDIVDHIVAFSAAGVRSRAAAAARPDAASHAERRS